MDGPTKELVDDLLRVVTEEPRQLPLQEITALASAPFAIAVDNEGPYPVAYVTARPDPCFERLTPREHDVAALVAEGMTNRQIADALFVSVATVKDHLHAILTKTGLGRRSAGAAAWFGAATTTSATAEAG
ncbi:MAG: helix-turn-helix transcriptional regulator [Actinomycetota bacterium]